MTRLSFFFFTFYGERFEKRSTKRRSPTRTDIIKLTESCRVHLNGSDDPVFIAAVTLRALWLITGDSMLEKKMEEMEQKAEKNAAASCDST